MMILKTKSLPQTLLNIIRDKGTEHPFAGEYNDFEGAGTYLCRQCGLSLFRSDTKFHSGCGWPSFDGEIPNAVKRVLDRDGHRTEILCARCDAHLGHVFLGEGFTARNERHCVNSLSMEFVPHQTVMDTEEAIVAAGCFWGVEHLFKQVPGVLKTEVGYTGGQVTHPTYEQVCSGQTGHIEALRVLYDPTQVTYDQLVRYFFEIHDPTQKNGQGPDHGEQYQSVIFYFDAAQKKTAEILMDTLKNKGYEIVTHLREVAVFWPAEGYHQDYYHKTGKTPYCHFYTPRF